MVKWGIMGTANIADWGFLPGAIKAQGFEAYAIAGRSEEKLNYFKNKFGFTKTYIGYENLINDQEVEAIYIPLTNQLHKEWVIRSLRAGKHVLCEKPLGMNSSEVTEMYKEAEANSRILMEAYAYLHSPYIKALKDEINSGAIGDILFLETAFYTQGYEEDFRLHKDFGGGAMYDLGCYATSMILSLVDSNVRTVQAVAQKSLEKVDLLTSAVLEFENNISAAFNVGMCLGDNARYDRLYIRGTKGSITSYVEYNQEGRLRFEVTNQESTREIEIDAPNNYMLEVDNLNLAIKRQAKPLIPPSFSIRNSELIDMVLNRIDY